MKIQLNHQKIPILFIESIFNESINILHPAYQFIVLRKAEITCSWNSDWFTFTQSLIYHRHSHRSCSVTKGIYGNSAKFTGNHMCQSLFFNKVKGLRHRCFPVDFAKFLKTAFYRTLLLLISKFLTHFWPIDPFYNTPWKRQKLKAFRCFQRI